jgi:LAO/AO transport system kinase
VEIRNIASTSVVVLVPHLGDEVQTLKAGLFEIADVFCVNKADLPGADSAARDLSELVATGADRDGWRAPVLTTSTTALTGVPELWAAIEAHETFLDANGRRVQGDLRRARDEVVGLVQERVERDLAESLDRGDSVAALLEDVVARRLDPHDAADRLLRSLAKGAATPG